MLPNKIDDNTYEITLYDFVNTHEDHTAGVVKRNPNVTPEDCDTYYWMYYPLTTSRQICAGDLGKLSTFIKDLNEELYL